MLRRFLRRFLLALKSGYDHATWGYGLVETWQHLRRPRPFRVVPGIGLDLVVRGWHVGPAMTTVGCLACPRVKDLAR